MSSEMAMIIKLIKKLLIMIFEKFEVNKEFEAIGIDIVGFLNGTTTEEESE